VNAVTNHRREAMYYSVLADHRIQCNICPMCCKLKRNETGLCRTRKNEDSAMRLQTYAQVSALNIDPMEKKPLYHFLPGQPVLSLGNNGCNLKCDFCQNWQLSQTPLQTRTLNPDDVLALVQQESVPAVAFTYAEPLVWFEYVLDTAQLLKRNGVKVILVTNGLINEKPFLELRPWIDALNIDVKSMDQDFYLRLCKGYLKPVLKTCVSASKTCHVEITNLVIPEENDSEKNFHDLGRFICDNLGKDTVLHISRYHPAYKSNKPATPEKTIHKAVSIAKHYLNYVYPGNLHLAHNNTCCPICQSTLILRSACSISKINVSADGTCTVCGYRTGIIVS
jgi:pyruvate formate lyase activating enzyme